MANEIKKYIKKPFLFSRPPKILLVDDDPLVQYVLNKNFSDCGCQIDVAQDGLEAMRMFKSEYDFILLDLLIPRMNGIEVAKNIRLYEKEYGGNKNIIIAVSGFVSLLLSAHKDAGFDDCYCKPFMQDSLIKVVLKWIPQLLVK